MMSENSDQDGVVPDKSYQDGVRAGLATAALALSLVAFLNLQGIEKSQLAGPPGFPALRGFEHFESFDAAKPFKGWWFAILRNHCIDILRKRKTENTCSLGNDDLAVPTPSEPMAWEKLDAAIERLSLDLQEILRLRYFGDLS